jgi:hypothetical protein
MLKTLTPTLNDGHDKATASELLKHYKDAQVGLRRVIAFGLLAWEIKELKLKHGQFGSWLAANCPSLTTVDAVTKKAKPSNTLTTYMSLTAGVLETMGFTVEKYLNHVSNSPHRGICHGGKYLFLADKKLPAEVLSLKEQVTTIVDGKTQRQLFLQFKQAEADPSTGNLKPKRGNLSGKGNPKDQRVAATALEEKARVEALTAEVKAMTKRILELADDKHLGAVADDAFFDFLTALDTASGYMRPVAATRRSGRSVIPVNTVNQVSL